MNGIYLHIPFCRAKCDYCTFYSEPDLNNAALRRRYLNALKREITERQALPRGCEVNSIYFGGGTPALFNPGELEEVLRVVEQNFSVTGDAEISIEMNPADVFNLRDLKNAGFNRFTLGLQTLNADNHKTIGRSGELCTLRHLDSFFAVPNVVRCIDIIGGIPGQTKDALASELAQIISYAPEHISAYLLSLETGAPLYQKIIYDETLALLQRDIFFETKRIFEAGGYIHYEISNYALAGFESRHNMKYWTFQPYIGFGAGAHSFYNNRRFVNSMSIGEYILNPIGELDEDVRDRTSEMVEYIMTGLRLLRGFSVRDFEREFNMSLPLELEKGIKKEAVKGMLDISDDNNFNVSLSSSGLIFADSVIYNVVENLL